MKDLYSMPTNERYFYHCCLLTTHGITTEASVQALNVLMGSLEKVPPCPAMETTMAANFFFKKKTPWPYESEDYHTLHFVPTTANETRAFLVS